MKAFRELETPDIPTVVQIMTTSMSACTSTSSRNRSISVADPTVTSTSTEILCTK